jgi:DNA-binding NarL/FixJ family response regulator
VAEDEYLIAAELGFELRSRGIEVVGFVGTALDAVAASERHRPDLVLMDIDLRGAPDGVWAAEEIWRRFGIRSAFTTANDHQREHGRVADAHPLGWLSKPYDYGEIERLVIDWAETERAEHMHEPPTFERVSAHAPYPH